MLVGEFLQLDLIGEQLMQNMFGVLCTERLCTLIGPKRALHAIQRR